MQPKVSIIMPVFNGGSFLKDSIDSILSQSFTDFEFIIVNDGSTDQSIDIIMQYMKSDKRIVLISRKNEGIVNSLNQAAALSSGEYIARMDADDISMPDRIEKQLNFLENNPEYLLVASQIKTFTQSDEIPQTELDRFRDWYNEGHTDEEIRKILPIGNCLNHPSILFRKEIIGLESLYKREFQCAEDYELFSRMIKLGKFAKLNEPLINYRIHPGQISMEYRERQRKLDSIIKAKIISEDYCNKQSRIVIWGCGNGGRMIAGKLVEAGLHVVGFIDKNSDSWNTSINGIPVLGDESVLDKIDFEFIVLATTPGREYAINYLNEKGYTYGRNYLPVW